MCIRDPERASIQLLKIKFIILTKPEGFVNSFRRDEGILIPVTFWESWLEIHRKEFDF
jgi:hypothetical protein